VEEVRATHTETSGGSNETETKELACRQPDRGAVEHAADSYHAAREAAEGRTEHRRLERRIHGRHRYL
jgi:hypothetical protein